MAAKKERPAPPRKTPSKAAAKTATPAAKTATAAARPAIESFGSQARVDISPDELRKLIAEAAYYRAKKRGFAPGYEIEDWVQAEAEVLGQMRERVGTGR